MPRTKIVATLGPASTDRSVLLKMMKVGLDIVRLNFSHGDPKGHVARIRTIRELNKKYRRRIKILGDLEGYRIRIGALRTPMELKKRQQITMVPQANATGERTLPFDYSGPLSVIQKGTEIFIDDGTIALVVEGHTKNALRTRVVVGGLVKKHKGVNMPGVKLPFKGVAEHDQPNIDLCLEQKVDYIAQSFVRNKKDILDLRRYIGTGSGVPQIIAKIEDREGIRNIDRILSVVDGIMVARGDMGVSVPIWEVPMIQKMIIQKCNRENKCVITATQMLDSMVDRRIPTRAEVTDVANAILDGADCVMLSAETAIGKDPTGCVDMMNKIIKYTERWKN